ncbi:MAG: ABC transporter ATP-binding protein [Eubacteriaceae bacterium]|nr:ABC transporter ATP-binding protein [Eubacteriaceae bacterium]
MEPLLSFDHVSVGYDERIVLDDFCFDLFEGEFVSVLGPNGAGKSTLINAVLNTITPTSGTIYLSGKDNRSYSYKERACITSVVPQQFSTSFAFTVYDIVLMGRSPFLRRLQSETPEDFEIVDRALRLTNTYQFKDRKVTALSGGERQRVVISGALAQTPKLLILDEPTSQLDMHHTLEIMQLIRRLNQEEGLTVLAVLHDINMACRYSDKLLMIKDGKKVIEGPVDQVATEDVLTPVYKVDMVVRTNRLTESIEVVPIKKTDDEILPYRKQVCLVCGGGSGQSLMVELRNNRYKTCAAVLNSSDSDAEACQDMGFEFVLEAPFCQISDEKFEECVEIIKKCDVVIVASVPFGSGNLKNLEAIKKAAESKKLDVYLIECGKRDFTGGLADAIMDGMVDEGYAKKVLYHDLTGLIAQNVL